jgi:DNA-binding MarR family transcriptional regulator
MIMAGKISPWGDMIQVVNDLSSEENATAAGAARSGRDDALCEAMAELPVPQGALGRTGLMLVKVGSVLEDIADGQLAASGLDARDYSVLAILSADGPGTQHEIARLLGKAPGIVVAVVDQLERNGLVERNRDPRDRRRSRVTLTAAGTAALARADELADEAVAELLGGLDAEQLGDLRSLLERGLGLGAEPEPTLVGAQRSASEPAASSRRAS